MIFWPTGRVVVVVDTGFDSSFFASFLATFGEIEGAMVIRAGVIGDVGVDWGRRGIPGKMGNSIGAPFGVDGRGE